MPRPLTGLPDTGSTEEPGPRRGRGTGRWLPAAVALAALALPAGSAGQEGALLLDGGVSHSRAPSGSEVDPSTYGLGGLRLTWAPGQGGRLFASAYGGLSLDGASGDWGSLSAGGDAWTLLGEGFAAGVTGRVEAFAVGPPFEYRAVTADVRPRLSARVGDAWVSLRGRGGIGASRVEVHDDASLPPTVQATAPVDSDLWYWGGGPEVTVPAGPVRLGAGGHLYDSPGGGYAQGFVEAAGRVGRAQVTLDLRVWDTPEGSEVGGGVAVSVPLAGPWSVGGEVGRSDPDPLLRSPPGVRGGLVVTRRVAELGRDEPVPLYSVQRASGRGARVTFRLERPEADDVAVLGDFSGWEPVGMRRGDDAWTVEIRVAPGVHHFGFRVDGAWFVPEDAPGRTEDDWGRANATLVVEEGP